jgi:hypothetical protein
MARKYRFKKGEYFVPLTDRSVTNNWNDWVLKQRESANCITPDFCPNTGSISCSWDGYGSDDPNAWRPATNAEIEEYKKYKRPVKVTDCSDKITNYEIY